MKSDMKFSFKTYAIGRNGISGAIGISFSDEGNVIQIQPLNTKGNVTNCVIRIPKTDIPAFCSELKSMCNPSIFEAIAKNTKPNNS